MRMGAGTFHPATTLRALGPEPWNAAYVQPCRRPTDGRYGENPNRLQHYYQYQVILKPNPATCRSSTSKACRDRRRSAGHDIRFVEDDWESPTLGAWGLGWEVWCDGMEVTQFTYFQQVGGFDCKPVAGELTYGLERLAMYIQGVDNVYDLAFNDARRHLWRRVPRERAGRCRSTTSRWPIPKAVRRLPPRPRPNAALLEAGVPLAAYDQAIEASHLFNLLQARGVISVQERASYIGRVRDLAKGSCEAWIEKNARMGARIRSGAVSDFLLELRCEEIPARMQAGARADLEKLFRKEMDAAGVAAGEVTVWSTPRRLALIARDLPRSDRGGREETKGPRTSAPAAGARRLPAQDRPEREPADRARRRLVRRGRKAGPRDRECWPKPSRRSSAPSPGPSRCAGARPRSAPKACAGCARCRASSRSWARSGASARSAACARLCHAGHRFHASGRDHHRRPMTMQTSCAPAT
jgi:glycyl-tRNA synthetase alpha chain